MIISNFKIRIIYWLITFLSFPFLFGWFSNAASDLLWQVMTPARSTENIIDLWENINTVWNKVVKWSTEVWIEWVRSGGSLIVKVTRLILILTIALSVTMILYNWMIYIIQTWQGKEWKSLMKNVLFIVVGIFVSLFSVVIINLIQSIPTTIDEELEAQSDNKDQEVIKWKKMKRSEVWQSLKDEVCKLFHEDEHCK